MKTIAKSAVAFAVAMAIGAPVASAQSVPTVHRHEAETFTARSLRGFPGWIYAGERYLDCSHGKINRTRWRCRFGWYRHGVCHLGRSQVYGESYGYNGQPLFGTAMRWRHYRCY